MNKKDTSWTQNVISEGFAFFVLVVPMMLIMFALGFTGGMFIGIDIVGGFGYAMTFVAGFIVAIWFIGILIGASLRDKNKLIDEQKELIIEQSDEIKRNSEFLGGMVKNTASKFSEMVEDFLEDTPIENYSVSFAKEGIKISIGDGDNRVKVDTKIFMRDPIAALEKARLEWSSQEY